MGYSDSEIREFLAALATVVIDCTVIELHVAGNAVAGLDRAACREGPDSPRRTRRRRITHVVAGEAWPPIVVCSA
jgi:hypothetical protein